MDGPARAFRKFPAAEGAAMPRRLGGEEGQGLFEYALIITLVAIVLIASLTVFGTSVSNQFIPAVAAL